MKQQCVIAELKTKITHKKIKIDQFMKEKLIAYQVILKKTF